MGLKKTRLVRADRYGLLKAAELAAEMIAAYERRRDGAEALHVESLDEALWDDVAVSLSATTHRWQVKRQMTDFSAEAAAELISRVAATPAVPTDFHLGFASFVTITDGPSAVCEMRALAELCDDARKPGLAHDLFANSAAKLPAFKFLKACLTTDDAMTIVTTLQRLHVKELGTEQTLLERAAHHLQDLFTNADEVVKQLHHWFIQYPDGRIVVDVSVLYREIIDKYAIRDGGRIPWIHVVRNRALPQWESHGLLGVDQLVERAWRGTDSTRIEIGAPPYDADPASCALGRLVLHASPRSTTSADGSEWRAHCHRVCAGTLGASTAGPSLAFAPVPLAPNHPPREQVLEDAFARCLTEKMDSELWRAYVDAVARDLRAPEFAADLRTTMQQIWGTWVVSLSASNHRQSFLASMLATAEEWQRSGFDKAGRRGLHAVDELARSTITGLAVAAAFSAGGLSTELGADGVLENLRLGAVSGRIVALSAASHPDTRRPCRFTDSPAAMLAHEPGLTILGAIEASASELHQLACAEAVPFHAPDEAVENYRHVGRPSAILTCSPHLRAAMRLGIVAVQQHLGQALQRAHDDMLDSLRAAVQGAVPNG